MVTNKGYAARGQSKKRGQDYDPNTGKPITPQEAAARNQPRKYSIGGQELSKADFEVAKGLMGFDSGKGGVITPTVSQVMENQKAKEAALMDAKGIATTGTTGTTKPTDLNLKQKEGIYSQSAEDLGRFKTIADREATANLDVGAQMAKAGENQNVFGQQVETAQVLGSTFARTLDSLRASIKVAGRDTNLVLSARDSYNQGVTAFTTDIEAIKAGRPIKNDVLLNFQDAFIASSTIEREAKTKGFENINYWLFGGGKDLEVEARKQQGILENLYLDYLEAVAIGKQVRAQQAQQAIQMQQQADLISRGNSLLGGQNEQTQEEQAPK